MPAMATSRTLVLETNELLENVLHHLDQKTLLLSQRVSHQWHNIIRSSPTLQEDLFFKPRQRPPTEHFWVVKRKDWKNKTLERFNHDTPVETATAEGGRVLKPVQRNALLTRQVIPMELLATGQSFAAIDAEVLRPHPNGSWRSMFLTQPPATRIGGFCEFSVTGSYGRVQTSDDSVSDDTDEDDYDDDDNENGDGRDKVGDDEKVDSSHFCFPYSVDDAEGMKMARFVEEIWDKASDRHPDPPLNARVEIHTCHLTCMGCIDVDVDTGLIDWDTVPTLLGRLHEEDVSARRRLRRRERGY